MKTIYSLAIVVALTLFSPLAQAKNILTCIEDASAIVEWQEGGLLKKAGMRAIANEPSDKPSMVSLVLEKDKAWLKGNLDQVELFGIGGASYVEVTGAGVRNLWTILPGKGAIPTFVFVQKAYSLLSPFSITVAYKCQ